ncbi:DNA-binding response regulator, partial [Candidatus Poribacteria bacterium]
MRGDRHVILVVDDDVESLEVIAQNLRRMGYEVVPAVDGRSAV